MEVSAFVHDFLFLLGFQNLTGLTTYINDEP